MTLLYLLREYLFYDIAISVLFQVHSLEEPIEYSHRERKAELHLKSPHGFVRLRANIVPHIRLYANVSSLGEFLLVHYNQV